MTQEMIQKQIATKTTEDEEFSLPATSSPGNITPLKETVIQPCSLTPIEEEPMSEPEVTSDAEPTSDQECEYVKHKVKEKKEKV